MGERRKQVFQWQGLPTTIFWFVSYPVAICSCQNHWTSHGRRTSLQQELGDTTGVLCMSLQHQPPRTLPIPFRLRKPLTSGIAMSSFHSLESQAGVKALNSYTVLWVGWLRNTEDCIPLCIFLVVGWAGPPQVRFHIPSHNLQMGTYSSAFQACQKAAREAVPLLSHDSLMMTEITQHGLLGLIFFCYWAENNVPLIGVEFDLKWEGFRIHIVIGPTSPLPNAPDTGISFILLTFYYLVNLSCYVDSAKSHW